MQNPLHEKNFIYGNGTTYRGHGHDWEPPGAANSRVESGSAAFQDCGSSGRKGSSKACRQDGNAAGDSKITGGKKPKRHHAGYAKR